jgi:uncharacterized protein YhhL (DUF1145 family)
MSLFKETIKKIPKPFIAFFTLAAAAGINYQIIHSPIVFIAAIVIFVHEMGHYIIAKKKGAKVKFPYFIPLPLLIIGVTQILDLAEKDIPAVAIAGPIFGFFAALLFILFNIIYKYTATINLIGIAVSEIIFNYFGSDGIKYRKYNRRKSACIS